VTISGVTIKEGSTGDDGGGIFNNGGNLTLTNSTVSGNSATLGFGGGILNNGSLNLTNSTVSGNGNTATNIGGGIFNDNGGSVSLINSTVSGNSSHTAGGIRNDNGGSVSLINSTVVSNTGTSTAGGIHNFGSVTLTNSIVANSLTGSDCDGNPITSQGYNLDSDNTCNLTATGDITNTNPLLGPLADNGGDTLTHALLAGSPAIDHIPNGTNGCGTTITTDQRAGVRPQGSGCDIGAYEVGALVDNLYLPIIFKN
jgi:hypothetical protein